MPDRAGRMNRPLLSANISPYLKTVQTAAIMVNNAAKKIDSFVKANETALKKYMTATFVSTVNKTFETKGDGSSVLT